MAASVEGGLAERGRMSVAERTRLESLPIADPPQPICIAVTPTLETERDPFQTDADVTASSNRGRELASALRIEAGRPRCTLNLSNPEKLIAGLVRRISEVDEGSDEEGKAGRRHRLELE
jgi:hypothetical protein